MSEQHLGVHTIVQQQNAVSLFSNNLLSSTEFQPIVDSEPTYVFTKESDSEILDITNNYNNSKPEERPRSTPSNPSKPSAYLTGDYINNFYFASLTVVGLYIVFRMIKKTR
jgi:hypothetical protein